MRGPTIPGYAPFNIQRIGQRLYVTYAMRNDDGDDDVPGAGNGYVYVFTLEGHLVSRLIEGGALNAPWGMAIAPEYFGPFSQALLVANFGDGKINAYDPCSGQWLGALADTDGKDLVLPGLWALRAGNGHNGGEAGLLYFTAGIPGDGDVESHGLFGSIRPAPPTAATPAPPPPSNFTVDIKNLRFTPDAINIPAGGVLTWTNGDGFAHTVKGDTAPFASGVLDHNGTFTSDFRHPRDLRLSLHDSPLHAGKGGGPMKRLLSPALAVHCWRWQMATRRLAPDPASWPTWVSLTLSFVPRAAAPSRSETRDEANDLKIIANLRGDAAVESVRFWDAGAPPYRWIQIAQQEVASHSLGGPAATRAMSLVAVAMNDATVAAWASKYFYQRPRPSQFDPTIVPMIETPLSPSYPSEHAVVAAAAAAVLGYLFPDRKAAIDAMASNAGFSRLYAGTEFPSDVSEGMLLGGAMVADQVIARAKRDGSDMVFSGSFPPLPGRWSSATPSFPLAGSWKPWALTSGSEVRLPPPPAFESPEMKAQVEGVKNFERTTQRNRIALFWQPSFIDPWIDTMNQMIFERHIDKNPPLAASIYALAMVAQHDATIACWDTKYAYLEPRPIQVDSSIQTLFATPPHPSFPSGHACASGAAAGALAAVFPDAAAQLSSRAKEAGLSTFYAGIHYENRRGSRPGARSRQWRRRCSTGRDCHVFESAPPVRSKRARAPARQNIF